MEKGSARRDLSLKGGFSLVELIVTFLIIGIISALLIPNLARAREEALRQTARQQVKTLEKALAAWYASESTLAQAKIDWGANGYITNASFFNNLAPYLAENNSGFKMDTAVDGIIYTNEMQQLGIVNTDTGFITSDPAHNYDPQDIPFKIPFAHCWLYWDPANRTTASPRVDFFLPAIPDNP